MMKKILEIEKNIEMIDVTEQVNNKTTIKEQVFAKSLKSRTNN